MERLKIKSTINRKKGRDKSVTLLELLIAIVLLSILVLALTSIDFFARNHVITADIRARLQNKVYLVLEHMKKNVSAAIGNETLYGAETVADIREVTGVDESARLKIYVDANGNGIRETAAGTDYWRAYRSYYNLGSNTYQIQYCGQCQDKTCATCVSGYTTIGTNIINFIPTKPVTLTDNFIDVEVTACLHPENNYDGDTNNDCGTIDNPQATMKTTLIMPSVSVQ